MGLLISYDPYQHDWYVGELYKYFHKNLLDDNINISYIPIQNLCEQYEEPFEYNNGLPSIFSIYSLIVLNSDKNNGFIINLSDYAPTTLDHQSAIEKLNITTFSMCSNLTQEHINKYPKYKIIPSFYILERWSDYSLILEASKRQIQQKKIDKCYFNGLPYGYRANYINNLKKNLFFDFKDKTNPQDFRSKNQYYQELSESRYGLSLNGAAKICYRDIEIFGLGVLNLRESLDILIHNQIKPNIHYKIILDNFIKNNIDNIKYSAIIIEKIIDTINSISIEEEKFIINNAKQWFIENISPDNQVKFLKKCLIENNIL